MADDPYARIAQLEAELAQRDRVLAEALAREAATAEVLRVIASSPTDSQAVLDTIAESAARLCGTEAACIFRLDGQALRVAAAYGTSIPGFERGASVPVRGTVTGRAVLERRTIHVEDAAALPEDEFPTSRALQRVDGHRTNVTTPLLREGDLASLEASLSDADGTLIATATATACVIPLSQARSAV